LYLFQSHFASQHKSVAHFASATSIQQVLISIYSAAKMKLHKQKYEPTKNPIKQPHFASEARQGQQKRHAGRQEHQLYITP
jgi:hypothetical protein